MRVYLVVIDESEEASVALRFASRRAAMTGGAVHLLALAGAQEFRAFSGLQATMDEEARQRAEQLATEAAAALPAGHAPPAISVEVGDAVKVVRDYIAGHVDVAALVLAAAREGGPGPLISHFSSQAGGTLPCPLYIIPGGLSDEDIDRLS